MCRPVFFASDSLTLSYIFLATVLKYKVNSFTVLKLNWIKTRPEMRLLSHNLNFTLEQRIASTTSMHGKSMGDSELKDSQLEAARISMSNMAVRVVEFSNWGYKISKILA